MDVLLGDGAAEIDFCVLPESPKCREQYYGLPEADRVKRREPALALTRGPDAPLDGRTARVRVFFCTAEINRRAEGEYTGSAVRRA
jgi:hypothetical protein